MQFIRAKTAANKLEIRDNRLFAIDEIHLCNEGFLITIQDVLKKHRYALYYSSIDNLYKEWEILDDLEDVISGYKVRKFKDKNVGFYYD